MNKLKLLTLSCLMATSLVTGYSQGIPVYLDETKSIEQRVDDALSRMTMEEKVAMCHAQSKFSSKGVPRLGIPEVWMSDGPHGVREEILWDSWGEAKWTNDSCTAFPALTCLAATFNPQMSLIYGKAIGEEACYRKKEVLLGPGVNIYRTPMNGRNFEYMGEDPFLASKMVVPYIQGVQQNGVAACVKHYALNNQEKWRNHIDVQLSDRALHEIYLPAFKAAITEGKAWSIMGSYNKLRGQHCCHNELLLNKILKGDWGFDGVVITDWGGAHNTMEAINNGLDIEMGSWTNGLTSGLTNAYDNYYLAMPFLNALRAGQVSPSVLDDKARRILRLIFRTSMNSKRPYGSFGSPEHAAVARQIAEEGIVLLKNSNNILPLDLKKVKNIAVIGDNATRRMTQGGGSSVLKAKYEISPLKGLQARCGSDVKVSYAKGYSAGPPVYGREIPSKEDAAQLRQAAVKLAQNSDVVLYFGGLNKNYLQDCEDGDRQQYNLPFGQDQLLEEILKVNKNVVVVLISGNAVAMPWVDKVPAILQGWYLGTEGGNALAAVLTGDVNPSGKLPFSFPVKLTDNGAHSFDKVCFPGDSIQEVYKEDILVGYRWLDTKNIAPLFAFGHGLSYTSFQYGKIQSDKAKVHNDDVVKLTFNLTNTGKVAGAEAVQVYVTQKKASVMRPVKELKGFDKVKLQAGESKQVQINLPVKDWAFYDEKSQQWKVEPGQFLIQVGASSRDIKQKIEVAVE
ncbi:MAG: glycoside hydrolase family 3 C-terminal domain-containing protein [Bacteroidota bacterium]|nr:glycoside hydrolase family 3 C-terminal domain-containing protein [Bacteroidota bacterium]